MKDLLIVTNFTIKEMIKRKSFIISTIIILVMIVVGFNIPNIIKNINGESSKENILIVDSKQTFNGQLSLLKQMDIDYDVNISNDDIPFDTIKEKIESDEIDACIVIEPTDNNIKIRYIQENINMMTNPPDDLMNSISAIYTNLQISKLGLNEEQLSSITPNFEYSLEQTEDQEASGNVFAIMLLSIVLFYAIYFCAYQVSSSITTEKTSKIMETLVTSTSPRTIVLGKTIGIGLVGLLQMCLLIGVAIISAKSFLEPGLLDNILDLSKITPFLGIVTAIYFILGYLAYALLYALTGSTVGKPEDIQSANTPVAIIAVISFYLSYFTMMNPTSNLNVFAAMFPLSSPFCMPFRVMMGLSNGKDIFISVAILLVTILLIAKVAIKIYSSAIFNYGTKMNIKDIIKVYKDKNN